MLPLYPPVEWVKNYRYIFYVPKLIKLDRNIQLLAVSMDLNLIESKIVGKSPGE